MTPQTAKSRITRVLLGSIAATFLLIAPAAGQVEPPPDQQSVGDQLFNIRHYILIADFPLANTYINALLSRKPEADPAEALKIIEDDAVLNHRDTGLINVLERAKASASDMELRKNSDRLLKFVRSGYLKSIKDPVVIEGLIKQLTESTLRGQEEARRQLREMAPWSIPQMANVLWDESKAKYRPAVLIALGEMGRNAVEPLCEALSCGNVPADITLAGALAKIGYPQAIPYIQGVAAETDSEQLKKACAEAVESLRSTAKGATYIGAAGQLFTKLGEAYYTDEPSLRPNLLTDMAPVWRLDKQVGVVSLEVPQEIYKDVMAKRCLARAIKLDGNQPEAVALWLSANIRKESLIPAGKADPTRGENEPPARYFAVAAGPSVLLRALARAVDRKSGDAIVAVGLARALGEVGFASSAEAEAGALGLALRSADRAVRCEVALAMALAHSKTPLPSAELVVSTLADALTQTGEKRALALLPEGGDRDKLVAQVQAAGYRVDVATTMEALLALARAADLPHVDLLLVAHDTAEGGLAALAKLRDDDRFRNAPTLSVATSVEKAQNDLRDHSNIGIIQYSAQAAEVTAEVAKLQVRDRPMSPEDAKAYALRAAVALREVAIGNPPGMNFSLATPYLIRALADARADLASACAEALSYTDDARAQRELANAALDAKADPARRVAMFKSLASSAKRFGNKLAEDQVKDVIKTAFEDANMEVRTAAAQAMGALNLPSVQLPPMIVKSMPNL